MATISRVGPVAHLCAEPNQFVLHYRDGRPVRRGAGIAYWFLPLSAAVAQVPVEDVETTFVLTERTADFQDVAAQCTLTYRAADPERLTGQTVRLGLADRALHLVVPNRRAGGPAPAR